MTTLRDEKISTAKHALQQMPESLRQSMFQNKCQIPLPQYDTEGIFKSYINPRNGGFKEHIERSTSPPNMEEKTQIKKYQTVKDFE